MPSVIYLNDMSVCRPASAVSARPSGDAWELLPYETCGDAPERGVMIGAPSFVAAPEVTLPLNVSGWHAIEIGTWSPHHDYDSAMTVKVKLDDDPCFIRICEPEPAIDYHGTYVKEAFFKSADLTGRGLVFAKTGGPFARKAYVAYVKLTPMDDAAVEALKADRARTDTRIVQATIDGVSFFFSGEYRTREHILEVVEPYRHSDVGKVIWAFNYGDVTNYPTEVGVYCASEEENPIDVPLADNRHAMGVKVSGESLRELASHGVIPQAAVAEHVHEMGLKFDAMFRLAILGHVPPRRWGSTDRRLLKMHPEFRQVMADGTPVEKASYAFPEVRDYMLALIRESAEKFDIDGVSLGFNRGPQFTAYEQPVLDDFREKFNEDARELSLDDPRLQTVRFRYLNEFVRDTRRVLDEVGDAKGKRLELGVWVDGQTRANRRSGCDVETWLGEGLLDSLIGSVGRNPGHFDAELIATANAHGCQCIPGTVPWRYEDPIGDAVEFLYPEGTDGIALWDLDAIPIHQWPAMSRMGHREEFAAIARDKPRQTTVQLKMVAGCDLQQGLGAAAYSGG